MSDSHEAEAREIRENELLAALSPEVFERLLPRLERVPLPPFDIVFDFDDEITHLYFPGRNTVISTLSRTDEGINIEVGLCGNEGAVGLSGVLGTATSPYLNLVQVPGSGTRMKLPDAIQEFRLCGPFQQSVLKYVHELLLQVSQTALCNRLHSDEERLSRWLLLSADRIEANQLPLPRQLLAKMLGRNHSGVSVAASTLERAGLITYNGAEMEIIDREKLESVTCSCYWVVKRHRKASV